MIVVLEEFIVHLEEILDDYVECFLFERIDVVKRGHLRHEILTENKVFISFYISDIIISIIQH